MYYSYKAKKKNRKIYKILFAAIAITGIYLLFVKYQQYIFFWKYTKNKISIQLEDISKIKSIDKKNTKLIEISKICNDYNLKNQTSAETFFLAGKISFQLGEIYLNKTFSEYIINNCTDCLNPKAYSEFINAIKNIRKGIALAGSDEIEEQYLLMLARSYFYCNYKDSKTVFRIIEKVGNIEQISNAEDIKFLSIINILNNKADYGLEILQKYAVVSNNINDRFFLAMSYNIAGNFTDAIMSFKGILENCSDSNLLKTGNINLGKIYFNQSLYKESLFHFTNALKIDDRDNLLKIWIGKNYSALGEKTKAKAVWNEVLASDQSNKEAKKLLGQL